MPKTTKDRHLSALDCAGAPSCQEIWLSGYQISDTTKYQIPNTGHQILNTRHHVTFCQWIGNICLMEQHQKIPGFKIGGRHIKTWWLMVVMEKGGTVFLRPPFKSKFCCNTTKFTLSLLILIPNTNSYQIIPFLNYII